MTVAVPTSKPDRRGALPSDAAARLRVLREVLKCEFLRALVEELSQVFDRFADGDQQQFTERPLGDSADQ